MRPVYATAEQVLTALESAQTTRNIAQIMQKLQAASESVDTQMARRFYPELRTTKYDYPNYEYAYPWQLWLGANELVSLTTLTAGGTVIPNANVMLRTGDSRDDPPYSIIEIDLSTSSALSSGTTFQRSIEVYGVHGWNETATVTPAATLHAGINNSAATVVVDTANDFNIGTGSLLMVDTERMLVLARRMSAVAGQALTADVDDLNSTRLFPVTSGAAFAVGEMLLIGSERVRVDDIAGNNLIVERAVDGTPIAVHTLGTAIYGQRTLTVERGCLGSTAAAHNINAPVYVHEYPALINELCLAETEVMLEQAGAAYARTVGAGNATRQASGAGLDDLRAAAAAAYSRVGTRLAAI